MPARTTGKYTRKDFISAGILGAILVLTPITCWQMAVWRPRRFYKRYPLLKIGMTETGVIDLFERNPDQVCLLGNNRILYFCRGAVGDMRPKPSEVTIADANEIPSYFGCAQLLFDSGGLLSAYTVVREESWVTTREGKIGGEDIKLLEPALIERLRLPANK